MWTLRLAFYLTAGSIAILLLFGVPIWLRAIWTVARTLKE